MDLCGATALITGGAHRLGREIALRLADAGANIVINYLQSESAAADTLREVAARGVRALALQADAADPDQVDAMLAQLHAQLSRVDLLVANAGVFRRMPLDTVTEDDWDDMMRLNFQTFLVPAQRVGHAMQHQHGGCIIVIADVAGVRPWADYIPYSVAKSSAIAGALGLAVALAPEVRVNAIAPGPVLFPEGFPADARQREVSRTVLRRQGHPQQVSDAVLYLTRNDYVTGTVLSVDGGRLLTGPA